MKLAALTILISMFPLQGFAESIASEEAIATPVVHEEDWEHRPEKKTSKNDKAPAKKSKPAPVKTPNADEMIEGLRLRGFCVGTKEQLEEKGKKTDDVVLVLRGPGGKGKLIDLKALNGMKADQQVQLVKDKWKVDAMLAKCTSETI